MVARFAPALSSLGGHLSIIQVAAAAGIRQEIVSARGMLQRAVSRLARVRDGRCRYTMCLAAFRVCQRAQKARNGGHEAPASHGSVADSVKDACLILAAAVPLAQYCGVRVHQRALKARDV